MSNSLARFRGDSTNCSLKGRASIWDINQQKDLLNLRLAIRTNTIRRLPYQIESCHFENGSSHLRQLDRLQEAITVPYEDASPVSPPSKLPLRFREHITNVHIPRASNENPRKPISVAHMI